MPRKWYYTGQDRQGNHVTGTTTEHPSTFVADKYRKRWRWLDVHEGGWDQGDPVGHIGPHPDRNQRVWWADKDEA